MTLEEFLAHAGQRLNGGSYPQPSNAYVDEPGFKHLYVRLTKRLIHRHGKVYDVIDIANVEAMNPGTGSFKRLIEKLREKYPQFGIFVENTLNKQFSEGLKHMGWEDVSDHPLCPCYFLPPLEKGTAP